MIEKIVDYYVENKVPPLEQFDMILINNRAVVYNFRKGSYTPNDVECIAYWDGGARSIALLLFEMNNMPRSEIMLSQSVMSIYLKGIKPENLKRYPDLELRMDALRKMA